MDTEYVASPDDLADLFGSDAVDPNFDETTAHETYRIWMEWKHEYDSDAKLLTTPNWYASKEFGETIPPMFVATVEYDHPNKGAVLFENTHYVDTNIAKNEAFDYVELEDTVRELDMRDKEKANHEDAGMVWMPRSLMTVISYGEPNPSDSITNIGTP